MTLLLRFLLIHLLLTGPVLAASSAALPEGDPSCRAAPVQIAFTPRPKAELLEQILKMDEPTMQMRGRLVIHSLAPVQVELRLDSFQGDPQRIAELIALWTRSPALRGVQLPIHDLRLEGVVARLAGKGVDIQIDKAILPEGKLETIHLRRDGENRWDLTVAAGNLQRMPGGIPGLPPLRDVTFAALQATGNPQCPGRISLPSLEIEGIQARDSLLEVLSVTPGREVWQASATRITLPAILDDQPVAPDSLPFLLRETRNVHRLLAQFTGVVPPASSEPLVIEQLAVLAQRDDPSTQLSGLRLSAEGLQLQGRARVVQQASAWVVEPDVWLMGGESGQKVKKNFKKRVRLGQNQE
ncbi:MAG: hypothetical protein HQL64_10830 [Magnetococcales bacterium]|nr:hypothetical protein [Magnetococcales bacterium]